MRITWVILQRRLLRRSGSAPRVDAPPVADMFFKGSCLLAMLENLSR
jgi:hypothetical protein